MNISNLRQLTRDGKSAEFEKSTTFGDLATVIQTKENAI